VEHAPVTSSGEAMVFVGTMSAVAKAFVESGQAMNPLIYSWLKNDTSSPTCNYRGGGVCVRESECVC